MNTIAKVALPADEPVVPAQHPDVVLPTPAGYSPWDEKPPPGAVPEFLKPRSAVGLLRRAQDVMIERAAEYDKPSGERSVAAVVVALNAIVGRSALTEAEGYLFMQLLKSVRLFSAARYHDDSAVDGVSYAALVGEAKARQP